MNFIRQAYVPLKQQKIKVTIYLIEVSEQPFLNMIIYRLQMDRKTD